MASAFRPTLAGGGADYPEVKSFSIEAASAIIYGDLVFFDTADNLVKPCAADPTVILGIALSDGAVATKNIFPNSKIPIAVLSSKDKVVMGSSTTPLQTHILRTYGVVKTGNNWLVDISEVTTMSLTVVDYSPHSGDVGQEWFVVRFLAAALQGDSVVS